MVLPFLINEKFKLKKKFFIKKLEKFGIETRPVISGSFINQPASKLYNLNTKKIKFEEKDIRRFLLQLEQQLQKN